jgi:hypothetical protein
MHDFFRYVVLGRHRRLHSTPIIMSPSERAYIFIFVFAPTFVTSDAPHDILEQITSIRTETAVLCS